MQDATVEKGAKLLLRKLGSPLGSARVAVARKLSRCSRTTWWSALPVALRGVYPRDATGARPRRRAAVSHATTRRHGSNP